MDGLIFAVAFLARRRGRDVLYLGAGCVLAWAVAAGVLAAQGALPAAINDVFRYGRALATDTPAQPGAPLFLIRWVTGNADPQGHLPPPFGKTRYLVWWGSGTWPLWVVSVPALVWLFRKPAESSRQLAAWWTLTAWVQVAMPRLFWAHYYLLPTPGLAVAVAVLLADAARAVRSGQMRVRKAAGVLVSVLVLAAVVGTTVIQVRDYLLVPAEELTVRCKGGGQWIVLREMGRELKRRTEGWPDPHLYIWGYQSPLAFYSGLDSVTPQIFADDFIRAFADRDHPQSRPRIERTLRDLAQSPPI